MAGRLCTCSEKPFYSDCECKKSGTLGVTDIFEEVMVRAREAELFYCCMVENAQCEVDKEMFRQFSLDERRHYALLQQILRELTCECYCVGEVCIEEPKGFCRAIKVAIYNEMQMSNDYENLACYLEEMSHREVLLSMIEDSRNHAERLAELYQFAQDCACRNVAGEEEENNCCCCCCNPCCGTCCCGDSKNCNCVCGCIPFMMPCCPNTGTEGAEDEEEDEDCCITYCCMDDDSCPCFCGKEVDRKVSSRGKNPALNRCGKGNVAGATAEGCRKLSPVSGCWGCR